MSMQQTSSLRSHQIRFWWSLGVAAQRRRLSCRELCLQGNVHLLAEIRTSYHARSNARMLLPHWQLCFWHHVLAPDFWRYTKSLGRIRRHKIESFLQGWAWSLHVCWYRCVWRLLGAGKAESVNSLSNNEGRESGACPSHIYGWCEDGTREVGIFKVDLQDNYHLITFTCWFSKTSV